MWALKRNWNFESPSLFHPAINLGFTSFQLFISFDQHADLEFSFDHVRHEHQPWPTLMSAAANPKSVLNVAKCLFKQVCARIRKKKASSTNFD